jgi:hypothetical protein
MKYIPSHCHKCGEPGPTIRWYGLRLTVLSCDNKCPAKEHFHMTCQRCFYVWTEELSEELKNTIKNESDAGS